MMTRFNIDSAAKSTKITENWYMYSQITFAFEDLHLEALSRKWILPILKNIITRETVRFNELKKLIPGITSTILSGTSQSVNETTDFQNQSVGGGEITLTITDITREEEVNNWKEQVRKLLNGNGLDVLINNAGVLTPGPMEILLSSAIRHEFEVNVFGSLATIHAFLPLLRQAKGCIVSNRIYDRTFPLPSSGPSSASKAAMEAFADVYRIELKPFGIDFIMVQPGSLLTGGPAKTAAQLKNLVLYGKYFDQFATALNKIQAAGLPASEAAARVVEISKQVPAPIRVPVRKDAEELLRAVREKSDEELDTMKAQILDLLK